MGEEKHVYNNLYNKDKLLFCILAVLGTFKQSKWAILLSEHMPVFTGKSLNVSLVPVKNKVAGTKYPLKLSDLLEILCTLGPEASGYPD